MITPCTKVCAIDPGTRLCAGCGRTLMEIGQWASYSDEERRRIMGELPERLASSSAVTQDRRR
jgi:uncharacterized protein